MSEKKEQPPIEEIYSEYGEKIKQIEIVLAQNRAAMEGLMGQITELKENAGIIGSSKNPVFSRLSQHAEDKITELLSSLQKLTNERRNLIRELHRLRQLEREANLLALGDEGEDVN